MRLSNKNRIVNKKITKARCKAFVLFSKGVFVLKANESVKNYPSVRRMYTNYAARGIKDVCKTIGPRFSGTEQEKKGIEYMAREMETCCDSVNIDSYPVHPKAFLGWIPLTVTFMSISSVLFFLAQFFEIIPLFYVSVALTAICLFFIITEFLFYRETLDIFMPKKTSHNAYGVRKASGETKRRIIFSGHADSSMEWRFTYYGGPKLVIPMIGGSLLGVVFTAVCDVVIIVKCIIDPEFVGSGAVDVISYILLAFIVLFIGASFFYDKRRIVEGANDNLTGCFASLAIMKFLKDNDIRFENTEVMALCTGSEEIGLRGAKDFCKKHGEELSDVETVFIGLDTLRDYDFMAIYSKDMTYTVKNNAEAGKLLHEGGKIANCDLPYKAVSLGASDAAAVTKSKCGIKATTLAAMDPAPARYYHTRLDTHDNLDLKTLEACLDVCLETLFLYDEKGLDV